MTENGFDLTNITISENTADTFDTNVDTDFSVHACQCQNFACVIFPQAIQQDESLIMCLEPMHSQGMANVVHMSNFNIKMYAGLFPMRISSV